MPATNLTIFVLIGHKALMVVPPTGRSSQQFRDYSDRGAIADPPASQRFKQEN